MLAREIFRAHFPVRYILILCEIVDQAEVMPVPVVYPADDSTLHLWKSQVQDFEDNTKAFLEGIPQGGRTRHRSHERHAGTTRYDS